MKKEGFSLKKSIAYIKNNRPNLFSEIKDDINPEIAEGDGMFNAHNPNQYVQCGLSAVQNILFVLKENKQEIEDISFILDFACGYGRVARVLRATFSNADMTVCDTDEKAVNAVKSLLSVNAKVGSVNLDQFNFDKKFDLIWVGSLFTHIDINYAKKIISLLSDHLTDKGVVVFTTHGDYVANRIANNEKSYNLAGQKKKSIITEFNETGYGFSTYPNQSDYGISIVKPQKMIELIESIEGLKNIYFSERGWVHHQDVFAFSRNFF